MLRGEILQRELILPAQGAGPFIGQASFQNTTNSFFFVAANATGAGDGSTVNDRADAATLLNDLGLNQLANKTIVLINDGAAITLANTASLDANTNIDGFGNSNSLAAFNIPVNVVIDSFTGTIADPTGNGAATLTTAGGHNLINLNGGNSIKNVTLTGGNFLVAGTSTGLTVQGDTLTSGASGVLQLHQLHRHDLDHQQYHLRRRQPPDRQRWQRRRQPYRRHRAPSPTRAAAASISPAPPAAALPSPA
ncbi:MAG: hypothetical protein WDN28_08410 [Chthoniobacter sp.]